MIAKFKCHCAPGSAFHWACNPPQVDWRRLQAESQMSTAARAAEALRRWNSRPLNPPELEAAEV